MRNAVSEAVAPHTATSGEDTWPLYSRIAWKLIPIIFLVQIFGYLDRANVGFAKLQFTQDLGISEAAFGLGAGLFYVGYVLFEVPSNFYLERAGVRATLVRIMVAWGIVSCLMSFITSAGHRGGYIPSARDLIACDIEVAVEGRAPGRHALPGLLRQDRARAADGRGPARPGQRLPLRRIDPARQG